jgi:hypothetical protein
LHFLGKLFWHLIWLHSCSVWLSLFCTFHQIFSLKTSWYDFWDRCLAFNLATGFKKKKKKKKICPPPKGYRYGLLPYWRFFIVDIVSLKLYHPKNQYHRRLVRPTGDNTIYSKRTIIMEWLSSSWINHLWFVTFNSIICLSVHSLH